MTDPPPDQFGLAVVEVVRAASAGQPLGRSALEALHSVLRRIALSSGVRLEDADDVAAETVLRLVLLARENRVDLSQGGAGLATVIARRLAVDVHRRDARTRGFGEALEHPSPDDDIAALIEAGADADAVGEGLRRAYAVGDDLTARLMRVWLDLAQVLGRAPTTREAGAAAGVSHMTVQRALQAFRTYVPKDRRSP